MRAYFEDENAKSSGAIFTMILMFAMGLIALILAEQIITGWIALGERANISRRDINFIEWGMIIGSMLFAIASFRTVWGIYTREKAGWSWSQWMSFVTVVVGLIILMMELVPQGMSAISNLVAPEINTFRLVAGLLIFGFSMIAYSITTRDVEADDSKVDKAQGAFSTSTSDMTPSQFTRFQLARSPSAGAIIGFVGIFLIFSIATDLFLEPTSIASILTNVSTKGIIAIGVTILMISGEFDLSVGSMLGAVSLFFMLFMTEGIAGVPVLIEPFGVDTVLFHVEPMPPLVAMGAALGVACLLGFINGMILIRTGIPSFIVTLGTLQIYRAFPLVLIPGGRILRYRDYFNDFPQVYFNRWVIIALILLALIALIYIAYKALPNLFSTTRTKWAIQHNNGHFGTLTALIYSTLSIIALVTFVVLGLWFILIISYHFGLRDETLRVGFFEIANGRWQFSVLGWQLPSDSNFRNSIVWWILLLLIFHVILTRTPYGNSVFAVGGNPGAARAQGINVNRVKVLNFILVAFLVGIAAVLEVARNPGVDPLKGEGWELETIAMTVIGGALLSGGYGSVLGTLLGALIFGMLQTGLVLAGMNARLFQGVIGAILIVAVVLNTSVRRIPKS